LLALAILLAISSVVGYQGLLLAISSVAGHQGLLLAISSAARPSRIIAGH